MARDPDCLFCKIVAMELPVAVVEENPVLVSFLDINPLADGHLLVVPREHYVQLVDMPPDVCAQLCAFLPKLGRALMAVTGAAGFNVLQNNGSVVGQVVPHVHFHLIPRTTGDDLGYRWHAGTYAPGRDTDILGAYHKALASL